jgi:multidrug resistance efflux pump
MLAITDPRTGRVHELHEIEWYVAQQIDGTRTIDQLLSVAQERHAPTTRDQIIEFVSGLKKAGLLEADAQAPPREEEESIDLTDQTEIDSGSIKSPIISATEAAAWEEWESAIDEPDNVVEFRRPSSPSLVAADDDGLDFERTDTDILSNSKTQVDPACVEGEPTPAPIELSYVPDLQVDEPLGPSSSALVPIAVPEDSVDAPLVSLHAQGDAALGSTNTVEDSLGTPLEEPRPPWYVRPAARTLRIPAAVCGLSAILAVIPYPRYVTDECVVLPMTRSEVRAEVDGILGNIPLDEGADVKADAVVAELDSREVDAALQQARAEMQSLSAKVEKMRRGNRPEEIARAEATVRARAHDLSFAKIDAERRQKLYAQGVGSAEARDNAARDLEVRRASLTAAEAELRLMKAGFRSEEVKVAEAELKAGEAQVSYLEKKKERLTIRSPIAGQITTPKFKEHLHARVVAGDTVCEVANTNQVRVEIQVPEQENDLIRVGQPVVVKVHSLPLHPFMGEVKFIAPAVEKDNERRFIRTVTVIDNPDGYLHEGMTGYGEIDTGRSTLLRLALRKLIRWVRVRFLI